MNYPVLHCPQHGPQMGRTVCCFCSYGKHPLGDEVLGRTEYVTPLFYTAVENLVLAAMAMIVFILPALYVASFF